MQVRHFFIALCISVVAPFSSAMAESSICVDPTLTAAPSREPVIFSWQDMMCLEHNSRMKLMQSLAMQFPEDSRPTFSEFTVKKDRLPAVFSRDVPLLRVVFPEKSFFDTAQSRIKPEAIAALQIIAEGLRGQAPDVAIFVVGHTDNRGGEDYNYNLSVDRANAVAIKLKGMDIGTIALWRVGFGEDVPLVPNDSDSNMALNRRVEFIFGARADPVAVWLQEQQHDLCADRRHRMSVTCMHGATRREFVAEALTARTLVLSPVIPRIARLANEGKRKLSNTEKSRRKVEIDSLTGIKLADANNSGHTLNVQAPNRIVLHLVSQQRRMDMPSKF